MSRLHTRPFDPTASAAMNLIVGEDHPLDSTDDYVFIPSHGPFYTDSAIIRSNGLPLTLGKDYSFKALHKAATIATGKSVACIVHVLNTDLTNIAMDYQVVGGKFIEVFSVLKEIVNSQGINGLIKIPYDQIANKPEKFNPAAHMHPYWEFSGWGGLLTPLNQVLQGVYYRKIKRIKEFYNYLDIKIDEYNALVNSGITTITEAIKKRQDDTELPLNSVIVKTTADAPDSSKYGSYEVINDRILGFSGNQANNGKTVNISATIVYPQPDNILLDESDNPILRDDDEWIYLDNQNPTNPMSSEIGADGIAFTGVEFNLRYVKGYRKLAAAGTIAASIAADKVSIVENETVTFTLTTNRYPVGLAVPYQLTGVGAANVDVPLTGTMVIGSDGTATVKVKLIAGSSATYLDTMSLEIAAQGGIKASVKYTLASNITKLVKPVFTKTISDITIDKTAVTNEFYLKVDRTGFMSGDSQDVSAVFTFDDGVKYPIKLNHSQNVIAGTPVTLSLTEDQMWFSLSVDNNPAFTASRKLNVNFTYQSKVVGSAALTIDPITSRVYAVISDTNEEITTLKDDTPFRFVAETNLDSFVSLSLIENTLGNELTVDPSGVIYITNHKAVSTSSTVSRVDRTTPDYLTAQFKSPGGYLLGTCRLTIPLSK